MIIVGIDPGKSGGVAGSYPEYQLYMEKMPETDGDILDMCRCIRSTADAYNEKVVVYLEKVGGFIGSPQPGSRMFTFGRNYGFLLGCLMSLSFKIVLITPQKWQKEFGLGTKSGISTKQWKNKLKAEAQRIYPQATISMATADALLILEYGRRCEKRS